MGERRSIGNASVSRGQVFIIAEKTRDRGKDVRTSQGVVAIDPNLTITNPTIGKTEKLK